MDDAAHFMHGSVQARFSDRDRSQTRLGPVVRDVVITTTIVLLLGLIRLGTPSLWVDEAATADALNGRFIDLFDGYHGLYYTIELGWTSVAGTSEWALRAPAVGGAVLATGLLVTLAHRLYPGWIPLASGVLFATSPFMVKWSQQARGYTFLVAGVLLATILLLHALEHGTRRSWALYGGALAAVMVWHPVAALLVAPAHAVLMAQRRRHLLPHSLLAAVIVGAVGVPWAAQIAIRSSGADAAMSWLQAPTAEVVLGALLDVSGAAGVGVLLAAIGLLMLARDEGSRDAAWLGTWVLAPFACALLVSVVQPVFLDRYLIVAAPAFALLGGVALIGLSRRLGVLAGVAVAAVTCVGLIGWYSLSDDGNWRGEDWRSAVSYVSERSRPGTQLLVVPWSAHPSAEYYGVVVDDVASASDLWVLTWSETGTETTDAERRRLGYGEHRLVERVSFGRRVAAERWAPTSN